MIMKILIIVCVAAMEMVGAENGDSEGTKEHNKEAHHLLCNLMNAAANKWREVEKRASTDPLRKALKTTLFGYGTVETLETLKSGLPKDYEGVEEISGSRGNSCGQPQYVDAWHYGDAQARWPGHSAPHDMVCLCTLGNNTWPLNGTQKATTLCGKDKNALGGHDGKGWSSGGSGNEHVKATWEKVVTPCLSESGKEEDLKRALETLIDNFNHTWIEEYKDTYRLGEGDYNEYEACTGSSRLGVCAMYYPNATDAKIWWKDLRAAIQEDEKQQEQKKLEEEKRKKEEDAQKADSAQTAALKSGYPNTNQTEASNKDNITDTIRKFHMKSGTPISLPSSWLLRAILLI
ncbi:Variant surface glycoprotein [Trypanosoma congolense IL3000]|uniref:Variant surface glycoprotein n=1 Tax=Trypanosoma congolense (strain IL3000) TaxID=1068625 RepID=F9WFR2_TRYCI|nr:Variant surface glycoprotein [Trypanosoma congolense IL3000]